VRDPVFTLNETQPWETSLLFGYGSYEQLRAGLEIRHFNFLGEAGVGTLKLVQSMKSTRGDLSYSFPQFFGHRIDSLVKAYALRREELQLERREAGLRLAFSRPLKFLGAVATAGYLYEELRYEQAPVQVLSTEPASGDTTAASLEFNLTRDRRDSFIRPREGYHWFFQSEFASPTLGGSSEYQRVELGMSYHRPLAQGAWLHVGLTHGVVATWGGSDSELPVNKLFFPGGDNSIRGYTQGEAAPRNPDGTYSGARCYIVLNLETEFALSKSWSVVLFSDSLGEAVDLANYPFDTTLFSIGAGLRYQSIIGPVRMEYGYNLNPRPYDPSGTLLFSLGFPF
jgi:outer membrane protein assembly factor BamA